MKKKLIAGLKIVGIERLKKNEASDLGLDDDCYSMKIVLSDGSYITALADEEGNGPGVLVMGNDKGETWDVRAE